MFKKKKKAVIYIENTDDVVDFRVSWDKTDKEQIGIFIKLLIMLEHGNLKEHIEKAIMQYGAETNDESTANDILSAINISDSQYGRKSAESKYTGHLLSNNRRYPVIAPDEVLNIFKNSIT